MVSGRSRGGHVPFANLAGGGREGAEIERDEGVRSSPPPVREDLKMENYFDYNAINRGSNISEKNIQNSTQSYKESLQRELFFISNRVIVINS